jgi:hypothetical protein
MPDKQRLLGVGLGMAGAGALLAAISMFVETDTWLIVTGTVFAVIGLILLVASRVTGQES